MGRQEARDHAKRHDAVRLPPQEPDGRWFPEPSTRADGSAVGAIGRRSPPGRWYARKMSPLPTRILLATDGSDSAASAARAAAEISNKTGAELHAVYVEPTMLGREPSLTVIAGSLAPDASAEVYEQILQDILETLHAGAK